MGPGTRHGDVLPLIHHWTPRRWCHGPVLPRWGTSLAVPLDSRKNGRPFTDCHLGKAAWAVPALAMDRSRFAVGPFDEIGRCELVDALGVATAIGVVE